MQRFIDMKAFGVATSVTVVTLVLILVGSRNLQNYDAALIAYLFGTLFAVFGIVYRYTVWIQRPPTEVYFRTSFRILFSKEFLRFLWFTIKDFVRNIVLQRFIIKRGKKRGIAHLLMAIGCIRAFAITIPLTFGWIHFTLIPETGLNPQAEKIYSAHFFRFKVMNFPVKSFIGYFTFLALNWC